MPPETITLDGAAAARAQFIEVRAFVDDGRIRKSNPGYVCGVGHDVDVAFRRHHRAPNFFRAEFVTRDKRILVRPDVVIIIRPIVDSAAPVEARFRRQGRPADVILARAPGNPGRRPFVPGHPDPTDASQAQPAAIMIGGPTKRLIGNPSPTGVAINPAAFGVGPPIARLFGLARLPDVAVFARLSPFAVRLEFLVKHSVGGRGPFLRPRLGSLGHHGLRRLLHWRRTRRRDRFPIRDRFFARLQLRLLLGQTLLLRLQAFRSQTVLHLSLDLGFFLFFGLLFLAGNKKGQGSDEREKRKLLHGVIRHRWCLLIRMYELNLPQPVGEGEGDGVGEIGIMVTFSIV